MELIGKDYIEVTVDCYFSKDHELKCLVPRERIEVRSGEVSKGVTRKGLVYDYLFKRLRKIHGVVGCITVQLFIIKYQVISKDLKSTRGLVVDILCRMLLAQIILCIL